MQRLHPDRVLVRYDRTALRPGIIHLGIGAFMRAHLAVATEAAIEASGDPRWGITGVSLRQPDTRDALAPQQGLYTLAIRDADEHGQPRQRLQVIGCVRELLVAPEDPRAVLERIAHEDAHIVSLTVTEKGYCHDPATGKPVLAEPFFDWAVEDRFAAGRPDWTKGGARFVNDAAPWERLKLRMVNGAHSTIAYLGAVAGWRTVDEAIAQPAMRQFIEALMREEIEPTLPALPGLDLAAYRAQLLQRFANPALAHRLQQIAMDGSQKLPQRLLGTVRDRLAAGAPITRLALGIAGWLHYLRGVDERGEAYAIDDPLAQALSQTLRAADGSGDDEHRAHILSSFTAVFGDLAGDPRLARALAPHLRSLRESGVTTTAHAPAWRV